MAVDIFNPPAGSPLGPGIPYQVRQLPTTVIEPPGHWEIGIMDNALVDTMLVRQLHRFEGNQAPTVGAILGDPALEHTYLPSSRTLTRAGNEATFRARLFDQGGAHLVEASQVLGVWDNSYAWMLPSSAIQGGFTPTDRTVLTNVSDAVRLVLPASTAGGAQLVMAAIDLVRGPPRSLLRTFGQQLLEGRGTIPVVPSGALFTFGGTWSWFTVPAGYGFRDGVVKEYSNRVLQLQVLREGADDSLYNDILTDENAEGGFVQWQVPNPSEIHYDLAPGWVAVWRWLV